MEQGIQSIGINLQEGLFLVNQAFIDHIHGNAQRSLSRTLTIAALQHEELAFFDGELNVLHIAIMFFERVDDVHKLLVDLGQLLFHVIDMERCTNTCNNVFALGIHQIFTVNARFTGGRVTGERHAGAGIFAHVAVNHFLNVDGRAPVRGDVVHMTIVNGTIIHPAAENGFNRFNQLFPGFLREGFTFQFGVAGQAAFGHFLHIPGIELGVHFNTLLLFQIVENGLKIIFVDAHDDVSEHRDKAAIAVIGKTGVTGKLDKTFDHFVIQTEVENRVHHTRHGSTCSGTYGDQQRIVLVAEDLARLLFHFFKGCKDLIIDLRADLTAILVVSRAGFRGNGKAVRHRQANIHHLTEIGTFTSKEVAHRGITFLKHVYKLRHKIPPFQFFLFQLIFQKHHSVDLLQPSGNPCFGSYPCQPKTSACLSRCLCSNRTEVTCFVCSKRSR